jgi:glycosyltransferase involved in cell wall biosynthesis
MRFTYCWTEPSGYLSACVAELATRPGVEVTLLTWEPSAQAPFATGAIPGVTTHTLRRQERDDPAHVERLVVDSRPDIVVFAGWSPRPYRLLPQSPRLTRTRFVMAADSQIRHDWRQRLAPFRIGRLLRRVDAVLIAGERGYQLMRYWGVPDHKIARFIYGVDFRRFSEPAETRFDPNAVWPQTFLFAGRYAPEKGLDVLIEAYRRYRGAVTDPWPLTACGTGPLAGLLAGEPGVTDAGFLQPVDLAKKFREAGVFVLPSVKEPWGQVIVEAAAGAIPVVCSRACGAGADMIRDFHSGLIVPTGDSESLAMALRWMHDHASDLPALGRNAQAAARAYAAERWADSQLAIAERLTGIRPAHPAASHADAPT